MAEQSDEIGVSISGAIDAAANSGQLSVQTKSRFLAAVDRLLGALFDLPATWIDNVRSSSVSSAEIKREFREHHAKLAREALERDDQQEARRLQLRAAAELRELEHTLNIAAVVGETARLLEDNSELPEEAANGPDDADAPINDDWLQRFQQYASGASSDKLRHMWARVLRGETRKPGSFSASALRFVAELDQAMAQRCEAICHRAIDDSVYPTQAEQEGASLSEALALQAAGLVTGVGGLISRGFTISPDGVLRWIVGNEALELRGQPGHVFNVTTFFITDLGREVFTLLRDPDIENNFRMLFPLMDSAVVTEAWLYHLAPNVLPDGSRPILSKEALKTTTQ
jgi:hypothetical protein